MAAQSRSKKKGSERGAAVDCLELYSERKMKAWLEDAANAYFSERKGPAAFSPISAAIATADTPAQGLAMYVSARFHFNAQRNLRRALEIYIQKMPAYEPEIWLFVVDLAWRIDASGVMARIESRIAQDNILDKLTERDPELPGILLYILRNITTEHFGRKRPHVQLIRRFLELGKIRDSEARLTLERLCKIEPDDWWKHFNMVRSLLHRQWSRIRETRGDQDLSRIQQELARSIFLSIGADRLNRGLSKLIVVNSPELCQIESDNWLIDALRAEQILKVSDTGALAISTNGGDVPVEGRIRLKAGAVDPSGVPHQLDPEADNDNSDQNDEVYDEGYLEFALGPRLRND